ncbi:MAG TPA: hypothetical protein VKM55_14285 [Candidatus Lokiarchaeia archaeon]|nr:hypothetical protein [Candidatus Lokiarchaeia archaeon]
MQEDTCSFCNKRISFGEYSEGVRCMICKRVSCKSCTPFGICKVDLARISSENQRRINQLYNRYDWTIAIVLVTVLFFTIALFAFLIWFKILPAEGTPGFLSALVATVIIFLLPLLATGLIYRRRKAKIIALFNESNQNFP